MRSLVWILFLTLAFPSLVLAQVYQVTPPAEIAQPIAASPTLQAASPGQSDPTVSSIAPSAPAETELAVDQAALNKQLSERNRKLRDENLRLNEENAALQARVGELTRLGGSEVHAYCPAGSNTISRNTAGAESNCALAGYTCEQVSGLCHTSCQSSDMCSAGFLCKVEEQRCVPAVSGEAADDG